MCCLVNHQTTLREQGSDLHRPVSKTGDLPVSPPRKGSVRRSTPGRECHLGCDGGPVRSTGPTSLRLAEGQVDVRVAHRCGALQQDGLVIGSYSLMPTPSHGRARGGQAHQRSSGGHGSGRR